ncbi:MAG: hydantoinase B/oxoprolinase family protein [Planctomycetaceae bacterium]
MNAADLAVFDALFRSVADEMGLALERAASSVNIKERRDLSCAVFDEEGRLLAQAAHIPVHLGAMPLSVRAVLERRPPGPGDVILLNDPWAGGTHLPDVTAVTRAGRFLLANRAHHADIGGASPGSLGMAYDIHGEGLRIPPVRLVRGGRMDEDLLDLFCANVRSPRERREDLVAQVATLRRGTVRLEEAARRHGEETLVAAGAALREAARLAAVEVVRSLRPGVHSFEDCMDGGFAVRVALTVRGDRLVSDFTGTHPQVAEPLNANLAVVWSAVNYALALLLPEETPLNEGVRDVLEIVAPEGTLVNARYPAPMAGGNVETSQRLVDVVLGALASALPEKIPAASQGTMNNLTVGGEGFSYYETIAGGAGGGPDGPGASALHTHMTNTRNTPIEALENAMPLLVRRLQVARGTGGEGLHPGGDGVVREIEFRAPCLAHLLSDRRTRGPYGLSGGSPGSPGAASLLRDGVEIELSGRARIEARLGDRLAIRTPGGGGFGKV